jgi:hypothetical protein
LFGLYALKIGHIFFFSSVALYAIYGKLLPQTVSNRVLQRQKAVGIVGEGLGCSWGDGFVILGAIPLVTVGVAWKSSSETCAYVTSIAMYSSKKSFQDDSMNIKHHDTMYSSQGPKGNKTLMWDCDLHRVKRRACFITREDNIEG